jgi:hypothetical protein
VFLAFRQQVPPHLLAQESQHIELLVVVFSAPPDAGFLAKLKDAKRSVAGRFAASRN